MSAIPQVAVHPRDLRREEERRHHYRQVLTAARDGPQEQGDFGAAVQVFEMSLAICLEDKNIKKQVKQAQGCRRLDRGGAPCGSCGGGAAEAVAVVLYQLCCR